MASPATLSGVCATAATRTARYHFNECPGCGLTEREDVEGPLDSYSSFYCDKCDGNLSMLPFNQAVARITDGAGRRALLAHHAGATRALERHGLHGGHGCAVPLGETRRPTP